MLNKELIKNLTEKAIEGTENFLVDINVSPSNKIIILVDNDRGVSIDDCVKISRAIESELDRDQEDFALEVSSPGLDQPFRVPRQYLKNVGRKISVVLNTGEKHTGTLVKAEEGFIEIEEKSRKKPEGKKQKKTVVEIHKFTLDEIKEAKAIISFN